MPPKILNNEGLDRRSVLLGEEFLTPTSQVVVVEGLFSYARLMTLKLEHNLPFTPVATLGTQVAEPQIDKLSKYGRSIFLLLDDDVAGQKASVDVYRKLKKKGGTIRFVDWSKLDVKDVDDFEYQHLEQLGLTTSPDQAIKTISPITLF
jgi:DNA primase